MIRNMFAAVALLALVHSGSASADTADDNAVLALKQAADALDIAFENQDPKAITELMTADHVAVTPYYAAAFAVDRLLGTLDHLTYTITATETTGVSLIGPETALVTQRKSYEGTFEGRPMPARVYATALWVRQDGHWLEKLYQETAIGE
jgi:ketosteroid isomerase-like protein